MNAPPIALHVQRQITAPAGLGLALLLLCLLAGAQALLFKPFSQLDDSDNRTQCGSALVLSIVSSLARLMGGAVGVDSTPGSGATFWFRVRVAVAGSTQTTV